MDRQLLRESRGVMQLPLPFALRTDTLASIFDNAFRELKPRTPVPEIRVEFFPFAGINHTARLREGLLTIRISDLFNEAPPDVHHALALILMSKLYRKKIDRSHHRTYRLFILRDEIRERAQIARSHRGRDARVTAAQGRYVDLENIFDRLNVEYFSGTLQKPNLSWSAKRSRHILGRYDVVDQTIFLSRLFDSPRVPDFVTEYVMYHEMLHVKHQSHVQHCRVIVHTPDFKKEEQSFARYQEAKNWLKGI